MCDEYDDERMRAFWRQLAMQEELVRLESESENVDEPIVKPAAELVEPKKTQPRSLLR